MGTAHPTICRQPIYEIEYTPRAVEDLKCFNRHEQQQIVDGINVDEEVIIVEIQRIGEKQGNAFFFRGKQEDV